MAAVVLVWVLVVSAAGALRFVEAVVTRPAPPAPTESHSLQVHVVQPGETFWSIARTIDPHGDPRPLVDRLVAEHGTPVLYAGEELLIPASV